MSKMANVAAQGAPQEKTDLRTGFFYSFGEIGSQLSWYMINTYLTIFYTDIVGLSAASISLMLFLNSSIIPAAAKMPTKTVNV